jgi:hypothetical protein
LTLKDTPPQFDIGDVVIDLINKDVGVLIRKYVLFDHYSDPYYDPLYEEFEEDNPFKDIIVWDIYWTGHNNWILDEPLQTYTEEGLQILLFSGALAHYKNT